MQQIDKAIADVRREIEELAPAVSRYHRLKNALKSLEDARQDLEEPYLVESESASDKPINDAQSSNSAMPNRKPSVAEIAEAALRKHGGEGMELRANELLK